MVQLFPAEKRERSGPIERSPAGLVIVSCAGVEQHDLIAASISLEVSNVKAAGRKPAGHGGSRSAAGRTDRDRIVRSRVQFSAVPSWSFLVQLFRSAVPLQM